MRFFLTIFVIATVLAMSHGDEEIEGCPTEIEKVQMTIRFKGTWTAGLEDKSSDDFKSNESSIQRDLELAMTPVLVCNATVERFYPGVFADILVYMDRVSYNESEMTYGRMKEKIEDFASTDDATAIESVSSVTCNSEVKYVRMMPHLRWDWNKNLKKSDSEQFKEKQDELRLIIENATSPLKVCNVIVKKFYKGVYADTLVQFDSDSYNENKTSYKKLEKKMKEYAKTERDTYLLSVSSVTSNGQVPTILGATFMCTVFEMLWRLL